MVEFWPPIGLRIKTIIISYQKFDTVNVVKMTRNKFGKNTLTGDFWRYWLNVTFCSFFCIFSEGVYGSNLLENCSKDATVTAMWLLIAQNTLIFIKYLTHD